MKIYTKTGDNGMTSLIGGHRVSKDDIQLEAYGTADELNSFVGLLRASQLPEGIDELLHDIQNSLFVLGGLLATKRGDTHRQGTIITPLMVTKIESYIDNILKDLPEIHAFILPGGSQAISLCHICRTITRRLERRMVSLNGDGDAYIEKEAMQYVNRLSDFFFALARRIAHETNSKTFLWKT